ncbi:uncharacterized protein GGS25DRAFT_534560 [Hypoxylon fragiforme]|uniref:uncharacterized protein n=1 Tax=Hypoxylon fragiforme TaxID=63214 RepID=UPI0020C63655|nr:uncharacterized protein GGS25DRAFT_534560 [Hypoxylon fragiforme]KAI2604050.1 hypothetical protein GGS25DRAFT_534560 [Hypoxylon fragiforme]
MYTKAALISALLAIAEARFSQEQIPVADIQALGSFGNSGEAATLAGGVPGVLLAAADPCAKLTLADKIVTTLGNDPQVISAAQKLVAAEQNFNPFAVSIPSICGDASLPATEALRGIVPLVDPAVGDSDIENANSATSLQTPFDAAGLSVAEVMTAQGFSNFTVKGAAAGGNANTGNANAGNNNNGNNNGNNNNNNNNNAGTGNAATTSAAASATATATKCSNRSKTATSAAAAATSSAASNNNTGNNNNNNAGNNSNNNNNNNNNAGNANGGATAQAGAGAVTDPVTGTFTGFVESSLGLNFGACVPTVKFEESLNGRKAGEFTFQAQDPVVNKGQQEALNPNIIFNRICDQLGNVCGAAADAIAACKSAQASLGGGAKDATTADAWNEALGFAGTDLNPDNAPQAGLVGHT